MLEAPIWDIRMRESVGGVGDVIANSFFLLLLFFFLTLFLFFLVSKHSRRFRNAVSAIRWTLLASKATTISRFFAFVFIFNSFCPLWFAFLSFFLSFFLNVDIVYQSASPLECSHLLGQRSLEFISFRNRPDNTRNRLLKKGSKAIERKYRLWILEITKKGIRHMECGNDIH